MKKVYKRFLRMIALLLGLALLVFLLAYFSPIDPVQAYLVQDANVTPEQVANLKEHWGLNKPIYQQFFHWLFSILQGDFGISRLYHAPVLRIVKEAFLNSFILMMISWIFSGILGFILGSLAAFYHESKIDKIIEAYRQKYSIDKDDDRINKKTFDEKVDNIKIEETEDLFGNAIEEARENKDEIFGNSTDETIIVNTLEDLNKENISSDQEKSENPDKTIYVQTIEQGIENNRNNIEEENDIKEDNPNVEEVYNIENIIEEKTSGLSQNTDVIDTAEINKKLEEENELKFDEMYQKAFGAEVSEKRKERLKNEEKIDRNINSKTCKK